MKWTPWFYWNMMGILLNKVATCKIERRGDEICPGAYAIKITISKAFLYGLLIIKGKWTSFNDLSYLLVIINDKVMKKCRIILLLRFFHWIYLNQWKCNWIEGLVNTSNHMVYMSICWWIFSPDFFLKYNTNFFWIHLQGRISCTYWSHVIWSGLAIVWILGDISLNIIFKKIAHKMKSSSNWRIDRNLCDLF